MKLNPFNTRIGLALGGGAAKGIAHIGVLKAFEEEQIKIHRSNFWFFGWPKKTQLLNTLVHELRHRSSPGLGHNLKFFNLVERDTSCVLEYW